MNENLHSQTKLTEFAPLAPEEKEQGVGHLISKIFKFGRSAISGEPSTSAQESSVPSDNVSQESLSSWANVDINSDSSTTKTDSSFPYSVDVNEGRNLPNVLKRISNLLALKSTNLQAYGDTELKQYWMPDSVSRECYECCEKFTTFRRRHHCRVCGQIFCSQCCNQKIPGKIVGCTGDLRACTYCCKIVLAYLRSPDVSAHLTADLRAFQEDLQTKFASDSQLPQSITSVNSTNSDISETGSLRRKISIGYQEEKFALGRASSASYLSSEERIRALQNSLSLRNLFEDLCRPSSGMILQTHRYRLRSYPNTLLGSELVDWLISQRKANTRVQASAISQALLEAGYLECVTEQSTFCDGWALYRLQVPTTQELSQPEQKFDARSQDEPSWMQQIPHESSTTDSEAELQSPCTERIPNRLPSSSSSYMLDLNIQDSTVHLTRPPPSTKSVQDIPDSESRISSVVPADVPIVKTSQHRELVPETGWHNATNLRDDNGERIAYELLTNVYKQHEISLLTQLLSVSGLSLTWRETVLPLVHDIIDKIRPDLTHDAEYLDIRNYIQFKKISGGTKSECKLVDGIVCSKNIAHRGMASRLDNPKILLLNCSLVYQRTEGRLMSLEPVILQELEYLRNVAARIVALQPNLVLVHRNVSRLAQDLLREYNITLVLNVKLSILERLARCTDADLVTSVDAHLGRSRLGTCKHFYLKTFSNKETGMRKTLMFFEGLPFTHLGATILLRGASKPELSKLKHVVSTLIFSSYNWRLEKSFLMDEFVQPPNPKADEFFSDGSSKESSPDFNVNLEIKETSSQSNENKTKDAQNKDNTKLEKSFTQKETHFDYAVLAKKDEDNDSTKEKTNSSTRSSNDEKKLPTESIEDFSDPLHLYLNVEDDVFKTNNNQQFSVAELPFSNKFRKALDDTILSISPYLKFSVPYLETDIGRKCKLRSFFPEEIYFSDHFTLIPDNIANKNGRDQIENVKSKVNEKLNPPHPFVSVSITTKISDSPEIQSLLANFRACGGRLPHKKPNLNQEEVVQVRQKSEANHQQKNVDILELKNHQKLAVLFCSFSPKSNNAPAFCVDPWVVYMYFYGTDDIPLGCFLERFCFRSTYACPSETCETPMLHHIRRFVHNSGCVSLSLNSFDSQFKEENIVMWSWCTKCSAVSPVVPMSADTWSFSLAKYLELRFHGHVYSRRGSDACSHSLHHDHYQYFGYKNIVASFKFTTVKQWEVSLPPPLIQINYDTTHQQAEIIDEIKSLALRGHEIFSVIFDKLSTLPNEGDPVDMLKQQLQKEHNVFKGKVEEVQLKLTSPTLENKKLKDFSQEDVQMLLWPLEDLMVQLKRIIADTVESWNLRLIGSHKKDSDKRKDKPQPSHVIEDTDMSETEGSVSSDTRLLESTVDVEHAQKCENTSTMESSTSSSSIITKKIKSLDHGDPLNTKFTESQENFHLSKFEIPKIQVNNTHDVVTSTPVKIKMEKLNKITPLTSSETDKKLNTDFLHLNTNEAHLELDFKKLNWLLTPPALHVINTNQINDKQDFSFDINKKFRKFKSYPCDNFTGNLDMKINKVSDDNISHSPKGHFRSQSDGTVMAQSEDLLDLKREQTDKKSVKAILTQLLQSVHGITHIQCPFSQQEHHLLPHTTTVPIVVYENEPGSVIAYALDSYEYKRSIDEFTVRKVSSVEQSPSPVHRRKALSTCERPSSTDLSLSNEKHSSLLSFLWTTQKGDVSGSSPVVSAGETSESEDAVQPTREKVEDPKKSKPPYIEVEFQDVHCNFCCRVYYAERFVWLRNNVIPAGEEAYIRSLQRSVQWNARGGKSGSSFCKTKDDRFILKEMTKQELQQFLDSGNNYFDYMERCISSKLPTLLGKIVGVYQIMFRNVTTNTNLRMNLLVMENLFYNRTVTHKFDLKGSMRNRLVNPDDQDGEIVLMDENLLKRTCESPLYIYPHSKAVLTAAIQSDTKFLSSQKVMDYSLLVGLDEDTQELVVGIIDYIRTFTWDKKLEHMVKKAGMLGGQGKTPTIISPENYRDRFIAAMHRYFLQVPDRWTGLGKGLEC